jgi:hypothetical protein
MLNGFSSVPSVFGVSVWTLNDYRSVFENTGANTGGSQNRPWGVTTVWGDKKRSFETLRKASTPVETLAIDLAGDTAKAGDPVEAKINLTIKPSTMIPSYDMIGYKLKFEARDLDGNIFTGKAFDLPDILRSDLDFNFNFGFAFDLEEGLLSAVRASVVSPLGYEIFETWKYVTEPLEAPVIEEIVMTTTGARVVFSQVPQATSYVVRYGTTSAVSSSSATAYLLNYATFSGLSNGTTYYFRVDATNSAGIASSTVVTAKAGGQATLAPKIVHVEPIVEGFYLGFTGEGWTEGTYVSAKNGATYHTGWMQETIETFNITYEVEYGTITGSYDNTTKPIQVMGAFLVDGLVGGETYYARLRYTKDGTPTAWSEEIEVTTESALDQPREVPTIYGGASGNGYISLTFEPVKKATGYIIKYGTASNALGQEILVNRSYVNEVTVDGLTDGVTYYFSIASLNEGVKSAFSNPTPITLNYLDSSVGMSASIKTTSLYFVNDAYIKAVDVELVAYTEAVLAYVSFTNVPDFFKVDDTNVNADIHKKAASSVPIECDLDAPMGVYPITVTIKDGEEILAEGVVQLRVLGDVLLYEPFDELDKSDWVQLTGSAGSFSGADGRMTVSSTSSNYMVVTTGEADWKNYVVEGDIKYNLTTNSGGLVFRYSDVVTDVDDDGKDIHTISFYHFRLIGVSGKAPNFEVYRFDISPTAKSTLLTGSRVSAATLAQQPPITTSSEIHYTIVNYEDMAMFYINGELLYTLTGLGNTDGGKVGYRAHGGASISVDNLLVYPLGFTAKAALDSADSETVTVRLYNSTGTEINANVIIGLYGGDGRLIDVHSEAVASTDVLDPDVSVQTISHAFNLDDLSSGYYFKAFVWDPENFAPLVPAMDVS